MGTNRIVGLVLLIVGVVLLVTGINASDSFADQLSKTFTGRLTDQTAWYILGGLVAAIAGLGLMLTGGRHHPA